MSNYIRVQVQCQSFPEDYHGLAIPIGNGGREIPSELRGHPRGGSMESEGRTCCELLPVEKIADLAMRELAFGGLEEARRLTWVRLNKDALSR